MRSITLKEGFIAINNTEGRFNAINNTEGRWKYPVLLLGTSNKTRAIFLMYPSNPTFYTI